MTTANGRLGPNDLSRDADGKIIVNSFDETLRASLQDVGAETATQAAPATAVQPTPVSRRAQIAGAGVVLALVAVALMLRSPAPAVAPPAPTAPPVPTAAPTPAPDAPAAGLPRAVGAWAAPGGDYLGVIDAGRPYSPLARFGDDWVQIVSGNSGQVWVRRGDLPALPGQAFDTLPDRAPPTPIPAPAPAAAPAVQATAAPVICVTSDYGQDCGVGLDPATTIVQQATRSREWSEQWLATATAEAGR